jgi:hypothetical protein
MPTGEQEGLWVSVLARSRAVYDPVASVLGRG